jgi:hypothetical protein
VERVQQRQRDLEGSAPRIVKLGPAVLVVRLDDRLLLGQREPEANVAVEVAVRDVVHHLSDGPAPRPVARLQLLRGEAADRLSQTRRGFRNLRDASLAFRLADRGGGAELADGEPQLVHDSTFL